VRVRIVCYEDVGLWILGKFALRLESNLRLMGVDVDIAKVPDPAADVNHHIIYFDYDGRRNSVDTVMITHLDSPQKVEKVRRQLQVAQLGVCMSTGTVEQLVTAGVPRDRLAAIVPAHDEVLRPRPTVIGLTSKIHGDGRKREQLLLQLARTIRPEDFQFRIMGGGWDAIVRGLRELGFTVDYHDAFDYELNIRLVPTFDYYLYLGMDEGAMGFVDALAAGVPTIATPQGYHLDAPGGLTHPFVTLEELVEVFRQVAARRRPLTDAVRDWTWPCYARRHLEHWGRLLGPGRAPTAPSPHVLDAG
jgi:hypothetical protein